MGDKCLPEAILVIDPHRNKQEVAQTTQNSLVSCISWGNRGKIILRHRITLYINQDIYYPS